MAMAEPGHGEFPRDVEFVISALEAGAGRRSTGTSCRGAAYRVRAKLKLYSDADGDDEAAVYAPREQSGRWAS